LCSQRLSLDVHCEWRRGYGGNAPPLSALPFGPVFPPQQEGRMLEHSRSFSPIEAIRQWYRNWSGRSATREFEYCGAEAIERMAHDVGISAGELRDLTRKGSESADLLLCRMTALDLDQTEVLRTEPQTFQDLQRVCTMCESHKRCARDLARDSANPVWNDYCPNAGTLMALNGHPWAARREW